MNSGIKIVDETKYLVQNYLMVSLIDKHLIKVRRHNSCNVMRKTTKIRTIDRMLIIKPHPRNSGKTAIGLVADMKVDCWWYFRCIEVRISYWIFVGIAKRVGFGVCKACLKRLRFVLTCYTLKRHGSLKSCQTCFWSDIKTKHHTELFVLNAVLYFSFRPLNNPLSLTYQIQSFDPTFIKKKAAIFSETTNSRSDKMLSEKFFAKYSWGRDCL